MSKRIAKINHNENDEKVNLFLEGLNIVDEHGNVCHTLADVNDLEKDLNTLWGAEIWGLVII